MVKRLDTSAQGRPSAANRGTAADQERLAQALSDMARVLQSETDTDAALAEIVTTAVVLIPGTDEGSVSIVTGRREVVSQHPTGDLPRLVDDLQTETGQGPCLDAVFERRTVRVDDLSLELRWPEFSSRAAELGARSMLSFQLYVENDNLGALNLFSRTPMAFTDESENVGLILASHAAVAFADLRRAHHLQTAVDRRDLIGQAKGILMERFQLNGEQAFRVLVRVSQTHNRKLADLAAELVTAGTLPGLPRRAAAEHDDH